MSVEDSWYTVDKATGKKIRTKRYGRGKRWRVRNRGARTVSFAKRSDADAHDTAVKADLLRGVIPFDHKAGTITFREYSEKWITEHHYGTGSRETVRSRIDNHMIPTFGHKRMCDIRPTTVSEWLADLRTKVSARTHKPLAESTVRLVYVAFGSIMRAAVIDGVVSKHPCDGLKNLPTPVSKAVVSVWERERVNTVLAGFDDRHHAIPLVSATCGHRQGESFAVAVEDVNFLRKRITVRHQVKRVDGKRVLVPPKGGKVRTVPLPATTSAALAAHIKRYGTRAVTCECCNRVNRLLFFNGTDLMDFRDFNRDHWHPAIKAAGVTPGDGETGQHQLRHFYASVLIDGGRPITQVRDYMGHSSVKITGDVYGHLFEAAEDKALDVIDAAFAAEAYPVRTADQA